MIVPDYWAEAKDRFVSEDETRTVRRFGWSNENQAAAQSHADQRVADAIAAMRQGDSVLIREPKVAYNGADGLPIREEAIERYTDVTASEVVLTRNAYGAVCLNTPDVLFADVDVSPEPSCVLYVVSFWLLFAGLLTAAFRLGMENPFFLVLLVSMIGSAIIGSALHQIIIVFRGSPKQHARKRIDAFAVSHPDWRMRLYETPNGWRVLVTHRTFDPRGDEAREFFQSIGTDPIYTRMCFNQNCFRARLTPKPWRISMERLRNGVWPIAMERMEYREQWVNDYDRQRQRYAACRFTDTIGGTSSIQRCPETEFVRQLHDEWCQANSDHPIA